MELWEIVKTKSRIQGISCWYQVYKSFFMSGGRSVIPVFDFNDVDHKFEGFSESGDVVARNLKSKVLQKLSPDEFIQSRKSFKKSGLTDLSKGSVKLSELEVSGVVEKVYVLEDSKTPIPSEFKCLSNSEIERLCEENGVEVSGHSNPKIWRMHAVYKLKKLKEVG